MVLHYKFIRGMEIKSKKTEVTPQKGISENPKKNSSEWNDVILRDLRNQQPQCKDCVDKLGDVLEEMAYLMDFDGKGIVAYLLQYVADARRCLREVIQILETEKALEPTDFMHKS